MKRTFLFMVCVLATLTMSAQDELAVGDIQNSGCLSQTRGEESEPIPTIILTKEGSVLSVQLLNYDSNCATADFNVTSAVNGGSDGEPYYVNISVVHRLPDGDGELPTCFCPYNVSFTLRDLEPNSFYLACWWYTGYMELTEGEPYVMAIIDDIYYHLLPSINEAEVISHPGSYLGNNYTGNVVIPEKVVYNGTEYRVTSIKKSAFSGCKDLTSVTIPNSVTKIEEAAFANCFGLTSVNIPNSVTSIGRHAFYYCKGLTSVSIPNSVTEIPNSAFRDCSSLTSVTIPNSVAKIEEGAFSGCNSLTSITIGSSVTFIGGSAFSGCSGLTSVTIPNSVTKIGSEAFGGCSGLKSIVVENGNPIYDSRESCKAIIKTSDNELISGCMNSTIPNSVTSIGSYAFYNCTSLNSITIPNNVTKIGQAAFQNCKRLESVKIPNSVVSVGQNAFSGCSGLTSITISNSLTTISGSVFADCSSLTSVTIPNSVTTIEGAAFINCGSLTSVTIPNSITSIGGSAFASCKSLTSITVPNSVTSIGNGAFARCTGLTSIVIPNSVTSINESTFENCTGLTSVMIPNSVTFIDYDAFGRCSGLTSITIPNSVTKIGGCAFQYCSGITSVTFGSNIKSFDQWVFYGCNSLMDIYCYAEEVPNVQYNNIATNIENVTLHVPAASVSAYQAAEPWINFKEIVALPDQGDETDDSDYIPFVESGKIWHVASYVPADTPNYRLTTYLMNEEEEHDGKTYFRIQYSYKDAYNEAYSDVYNYQLVREENRRVYIYYEWAKKEIMLYDFTLKEGDTFYYEFNRQNCKVLKQGWLEDGPQIVSSCTLTPADTLDIKYRRLRTWTIGRETGSGEYHEFLTWVEGVGTLDNMFCPDCNGTIPCLAYIERIDGRTGYWGNEYLPFSFYNMYGQVHGCDLPTSEAESSESDGHHHLTYEMEGDRLHVYGKVITQCGPNNYAYFIEKETDDPSVHKIEFEIEEVEPTMDCTALHATDFYVPGSFDPDLNYIVVDNNGEEHPVINKTQQMAYRPMIEDGKVWKVGYGSHNPIQFVEYYYFDSDTIIDGKTCKQMMCQRYVTPDYSDYEVVMRFPLLRSSGNWYEEDKKVYLYDTTNKQFMLMYDFSVDANAPLQIHGQSYVIGPKKSGGMKGFKGVYRDVMMYWDEEQNIYNTTWLEGVGGIEGPEFNVYLGEEYHGGAFLMSCTVGEEVIYLNDEYEDAASPEAARKRRIDFTHTIKIQPKARIKREKNDACINSSEREVTRPEVKARNKQEESDAEQSLYGEYNDLQLGINLDPLDDTYLVNITDESGKTVYEKDINAGNIVGLNIDISTYAKGHYTVTLENSGESFTGEFGAGNADANGDGGVNVADVDFVIEHIGEALDEKNKAADVNDDGEINVADVDYIIERIV